jgi:glycine cleavage system T protein
MSDELKQTVFHDRHLALNATMVDFGGWHMPVQYQSGILQEHLATRNQAGLFDVSHMGRFIISGPGALDFLQHVLSNNAAGLEVNESQYTMIPNKNGGAVDDAYLYRFFEDEYLLVVNASNRDKDWQHFQQVLEAFDGVQLTDKTAELAMISLQGPQAKAIMEGIIETGRLPEPMRNQLSTATIRGTQVLIARTGYTGEPLCFELFVTRADAVVLWDLLCERGAVPIGLGARDTLRLEAGLPLYGHELGLDPEGKEIPIFACPLARFAVSLSPLKAEFIGKAALTRQFEAFQKIVCGIYHQRNRGALLGIWRRGHRFPDNEPNRAARYHPGIARQPPCRRRQGRRRNQGETGWRYYRALFFKKRGAAFCPRNRPGGREAGSRRGPYRRILRRQGQHADCQGHCQHPLATAGVYQSDSFGTVAVRHNPYADHHGSGVPLRRA